jgi:hypothetical protein
MRIGLVRNAAAIFLVLTAGAAPARGGTGDIDGYWVTERLVTVDSEPVVECFAFHQDGTFEMDQIVSGIWELRAQGSYTVDGASLHLHPSAPALPRGQVLRFDLDTDTLTLHRPNLGRTREIHVEYRRTLAPPVGCSGWATSGRWQAFPSR